MQENNETHSLINLPPRDSKLETLEISHLHNEILVHLLAFVPFNNNWASMRLVCQLWSQLLNSNAYYQHLLEKYFPGYHHSPITITQPEDNNFELLFKSHCTHFWNGQGLVISGKEKEILTKLYSALRENSLKRFMHIFEHEFDYAWVGDSLTEGTALLYLLTHVMTKQGSLLEAARKLGYQSLITQFYQEIIKTLPKGEYYNDVMVPIIFNQSEEVANLAECGFIVIETEDLSDCPISKAAEFGCLDTLRTLLAHEEEPDSVMESFEKRSHYEEMIMLAARKGFNQVAMDLSEQIDMTAEFAIKGIVESLTHRNDATAYYFLNKIQSLISPFSYAEILKSTINLNLAFSRAVCKEMVAAFNRYKQLGMLLETKKLFIGTTSLKAPRDLFNDGSFILIKKEQHHQLYYQTIKIDSLDLSSFNGFKLFSEIESKQMDSTSQLSAQEANLILLATEIGSSHLTEWNEALAIEMLQESLITSGEYHVEILQNDFTQLLLSGADPSLIIRTFQLPTEIRTLLLGYYAFEEFLQAKDNPKVDNPNLACKKFAHCYQIAPQYIENLICFCLAQEGSNGIDWILGIVKNFEDKTHYLILNGLIGCHVFAASQEQLGVESPEEKMRLALFYLEEADENDLSIAQLKLHGYNLLLNGQRSGIPQSMEHLLQDNTSKQKYIKELAIICPEKAIQLFPKKISHDDITLSPKTNDVRLSQVAGLLFSANKAIRKLHPKITEQDFNPPQNNG
jgi:hypothetical protein